MRALEHTVNRRLRKEKQLQFDTYNINTTVRNEVKMVDEIKDHVGGGGEVHGRK